MSFVIFNYYILLKFWIFIVNDNLLFHTRSVHVNRSEVDFSIDAYTRRTQPTDQMT